MSIKWRERIAAIAFLLVFFIIGPIANVTWDEPLSITSTMFFSSLSIIWTISIGSRITRRRERRYFISLGLMMLLWMIERAVKFSPFLRNETVERLLWYGYYIPIIIMPLLSLRIALCLGKPEEGQPNRLFRLLYVPAGLLIAGILTNDYHQLAFRFAPGFYNWTNNYSYAVLYYLTVAWSMLCILAALVISVRFSSLSGSRKRGLIPLAVLGVSVAGVAVYVLTDFQLTRLMNVPELYCFSVAAYWEACLLTGLIPSNTGYDLLFKHSHLYATIEDSGKHAVYRTALRPEGGSFIKHEQPISGGIVEWFEDITAVTAQKRKLETISSDLAQRAELQQNENTLKEEKTRLAEQQRIYGQINVSLMPQTEHIRTLVAKASESEEAWKQNMPWVCVIGAFIKRKSNLMLLAEKHSTMELAELGLAYRESLSYLELAGVSVAIGTLPRVKLSAGSVLYAYEEFEKLIESKMPALSRVKITVSEKKTGVLFDIKADSTPLLFELEKEGEK